MSPADIARVIFALSIVLMLLSGFAYAARRFGLATPGRLAPRRRLALVETLSIDPKRRAAILRCDGREHLVIINPNNVTVIARDLDTPDVPNTKAERPSATPPLGAGTARPAMAIRTDPPTDDHHAAALATGSTLPQNTPLAGHDVPAFAKDLMTSLASDIRKAANPFLGRKANKGDGAANAQMPTMPPADPTADRPVAGAKEAPVEPAASDDGSDTATTDEDAHTTGSLVRARAAFLAAYQRVA